MSNQLSFTYTKNIKEEIKIIEQKHALRCKKDTNDIGYVLEIRHNLWSSISRRARIMAPHFSDMA